MDTGLQAMGLDVRCPPSVGTAVGSGSVVGFVIMMIINSAVSN